MDINSKKRKLSDSNDTLDKNTYNSNQNIESDVSRNNTVSGNFNIVVSKLPKKWDINRLHTYFKKLFIFKKLEMIDEENFNGCVKLIFDDKIQFDTAVQKLEKCYADSVKLEIESVREVKEEKINSVETVSLPLKSEPQTPQSNNLEKNNELSELQVHNLESLEIDPSGLYGLKPSFLATLGIQPPLSRWLRVTNVRCDVSHLKDVMELAGHVLVISRYFQPNYVTVMYSHPLEAVQAISMLHGQELYGNKLILTMIPSLDTGVSLPKGLKNVGPGLGCKGTPLREIVKHFNKLLSRKPSALDKWMFRSLDDNLQFTPVSRKDVKAPYVSKSSENKPIEKDESEDKVSRSHSHDILDSDSSPEPDCNKSQCSDDKTSVRSGSPSNSSSVSIPLATEKPINNIEVRQTLRAPTWTPNKSVPNKPKFGSGNMTGQGTVGLRYPQNAVGTQMYGQIAQTAPTGQYGPVGHSGQIMCSGPMPQSGIMGQSGPIGASVPMGQYGPMGPPGTMGASRPMGPSGPMGPAVAMGPSGPMGASGSMGPSGPVGPSGPIIRPQGHIGNPGPIRHSGPTGTNLGNGQNSEPVMLEFKNLPPATTLPILCQKLSEVGQVISLQLTTPGYALVRFAKMSQALTCFQRFHRTYADGCLLEVRFV